ncbi:MAG: T9SS type A sorting domain-containing protein [Candidatus Eisenbacteria bacterium]|nr:T9SS type A sorting domain-containing protein [Candidatus Eisenbacteria bacterium]
MRYRHPLPIAAGLLLALLLFPGSAHAAWPHSPLTNVQVSAAGPGVKAFAQAAVSDGAGGTIIAWIQGTSGTYDLYAQRITRDGVVAPGWPAGGLVICNQPNDQNYPRMISDDAGGAFIVWADDRVSAANTDIYAARITASGTFASGWPAGGLAVSTDAKDEQNPRIVSDGEGGVLIAWEYIFSPTDVDIYTRRISGSGGLVWAQFYNPGLNQTSPALAPDGSGGAFLFCSDFQSGTGNIVALRYSLNGSLLWGPTTLCGAAGDQLAPSALEDGAGGCYVAWTDERAGTFERDVYALRINWIGALAVGWQANGTPVCTQPNGQNAAPIVTDGAGGFYVAWTDERYSTVSPDAYAQRMTPGGAPYPGWPADGTSISAASGDQSVSTLVPDGAGGLIVGLQDGRNGLTGQWDVYAVRITSGGWTAPGWQYDGTPVCIAAGTQNYLSAVSDGAGGVIASWADFRDDGSVPVVYAQWVDRYGQLGDMAPPITSVRDVKPDQGGRVRVDWSASYLDADPEFRISSYWIWRQAPLSAAQAALRRGARWLDQRVEAEVANGVFEPRPGSLFRLAGPAGATYAWEYLASQPASGFPNYSYVATTTTDSMPESNPRTVFMVEARATYGSAHWDSKPDSGYSVDDLAPAPPSPFTGSYARGATSLDWGASHEADLAAYRLHRGTAADFTPGPGNLVTETGVTHVVDTPGFPAFYKLAAVDVHGNVSAYAFLQPAGVVDAGGPAPPRVLALVLASPHPARDGVTLRLELPQGGPVRLAIHDVSGRRVRTLADGTLPAGVWTRRWDARGETGAAVSSGLYFARLDAGGRTIVRRIVLAR